jgi:L-methionine (R)-S-oxide reductase
LDTTLHIPGTATRQERYEALLPGLKALLEGEHDLVARMANTAAALHEALGVHWTGFYRVVDGELVLGPFQGPVACTRIPLGKGVCGTAWARNETIVVPDVNAFPGHIACSPLSRSEIVVPVRDAQGHVVAVLDLDSADPNDFGDVDQQALENLCAWLIPPA